MTTVLPFDDQTLVVDELRAALEETRAMLDGALDPEPDGRSPLEELGGLPEVPTLAEAKAACWIELATTTALGERLRQHLGAESPAELDALIRDGQILLNEHARAVRLALLFADPDAVLETLERALYEVDTTWSELADLVDDLDRSIALLWAADEGLAAAELERQARQTLALHSVALAPLAPLAERQLERHGAGGPGAAVWEGLLDAVEGRAEVTDEADAPADARGPDAPDPAWLDAMLAEVAPETDVVVVSLDAFRATRASARIPAQRRSAAGGGVQMAAADDGAEMPDGVSLHEGPGWSLYLEPPEATAPGSLRLCLYRKPEAHQASLEVRVAEDRPGAGRPASGASLAGRDAGPAIDPQSDKPSCVCWSLDRARSYAVLGDNFSLRLDASRE